MTEPKPLMNVLAIEIAAMDGYDDPDEAPPSYCDEATELIARLNKRGVSLVRTNDVVMF